MSMTIASSDQVANLKAMFPDVPEYVIVSLLKQNGCSLEATAEALIRAQEIASIVVPPWWDSFWQTHRSTIGYSESQAKQLVFKVCQHSGRWYLLNKDNQTKTNNILFAQDGRFKNSTILTLEIKNKVMQLLGGSEVKPIRSSLLPSTSHLDHAYSHFLSPFQMSRCI